MAASSIGASPARRSASPPASRSPANVASPSPQSTIATCASGARSPEAPTEPRLGTTGSTSRSSRPSSSSTSSGRTPEWPFERLLASSRSIPRTTSSGQRLADADGVRAHEVELQLRRIRGVDAHGREVAEARRHAVHDGALGDHRVDGLASAHQPRAGIGRERRRRAAAGDALQFGECEQGHGTSSYGCLVASRGVTDAPVIRAPRGTELSCKGWLQEAALRMLMNNLDPEVAEDPANLVVYGGTGRAARSWEAFHAIVATLRRLENDETLLVQSGKPVGVFRTHEMAPRVLIANSLLVPDWADWETFRRLEAEGLTMYGQMTAGLVDLHRHAGDPAGHVRDVRGRRAREVRRHACAAASC